MSQPQVQENPRCFACGAEMSPQDDYCMNCGMRSGSSRLKRLVNAPTRAIKRFSATVLLAGSSNAIGGIHAVAAGLGHSFDRFGKQIAALGFLLIVLGLIVYFTGPDGPYPFVISSPSGQELLQISVYDYSRPLFGLFAAFVGVISMICVRKVIEGEASKLLIVFRTLTPRTREIVSPEEVSYGAGLSAKISLRILGFFVLLWGFAPAGAIAIATVYLIRETPGIPLAASLPLGFKLLGPLLDTFFRFAFLGLIIIVQSWLLYFFGIELLWGMLSGLIARISTRSPYSARLSTLRWRHFAVEFGRFPSLQTNVGLLVATVAFMMALLLREFTAPLLVMSFSVVIVTLCERSVSAFIRACIDLRIDAAEAFKLGRRGLSAKWAVAIYLPVVYAALWKFIVVPLVALESVYISQTKAVESVPGILALLPKIGSYWTGSLTELISSNLLLVLFVFAAIGALYSYILPGFLLTRPRTNFYRKAALALVVFLVSYVSQVAISFLAPSSPNVAISLVISFLIFAIAAFAERSYSEALHM